MLRAAGFAIAGMVILVALSNCSTAILNSNTLNLATTVDDLAVRQAVFNLVKIKKNQWALPSQIQISAGQVSARTNVTPTITSPLSSVLTGTTQVASQVVGATGAVTTTTTGINTSSLPNAGASVGSTVEDTENWNVVPVQDPEQLRRLRSLYQYGTGEIRAIDLLCLYPIPEIPDKPETAKSDLQTLADALKAAAPAKADPPADATKAGQQAKTETKKKSGEAVKKKKVYVRGANSDSCYNQAADPKTSASIKHTLIGPNPDPAFLHPPGCVLCAYPNKAFHARFRKGEKIFEGRATEDTVTVDPKKFEYVPVVVNFKLMPFSSDYDPIDWLFVIKDGEDPPSESHRVGSSSGYTVYTKDDERFSEFVLAVQEATLQSPELQKSVAAPPPIVQTNPR